MLDSSNKEAYFKAACLLNKKGEYQRATAFFNHVLNLDHPTSANNKADDIYHRLICKGSLSLFLFNIVISIGKLDLSSYRQLSPTAAKIEELCVSCHYSFLLYIVQSSYYHTSPS